MQTQHDVETQPLRRVPAFALLLAFAPIALTSVGCKAGMCAHAPGGSRLVYAVANWIGLALLAIVLRNRRITLHDIGFRRPPAGWWKLSLAGLALGGFVVYPIAQGINALLGLQMRSSLMVGKVGFGVIAVQLVYAVLTAPIAEETLFRGFALTTLRTKGLGVFAASLISMSAFALIHFPGYGAGGVVFVFLWSSILTFLYAKTGSLIPGIVMHMLNNAWAFVFVPAVARLFH
jgi:membrane protease YdiL (CAAX protease family)